MREKVLHEGDGHFLEKTLEDSQLVFDKTPDFGWYPSSESTDADEDDIPINWLFQKIMIPTFE